MEAKTKIKIFNATFIIVAFFVFALQTNAASTDIIFTEIMYSLEGTDSNREWIEIYNNGTDAVSIVDGAGDNSWWFNDGSNHGISLAQGNLIIPAGGFAILADDAETFLIDYPDFAGTIIKTIMSLKNTEDTILLSADNRQTFFGEITYQNTWGANGDGNSLQLSGNNWIAATPTPGQATSAKPQEEPEQESSPSTSTPTTSESSSTSDSTSTVSTGDPTKVKITEIFPNPEGSEEAEFIELWNNQDKSISLNGWKLSDISKVVTLKDIILVPGEYKAIYRTTTKIALNNSSETVYLYDNNGNLIDEISYASTIEGYSLSYDIRQDEFFWSSTKTPSKANEFTTPNNPPEAVITFSNNPVAPKETFTIFGTDSTDPDDDSLSYFWEIGKNFQASGKSFKYSFGDLGKHLIKLTLSDKYHEIITTAEIDVVDAVDVVYMRSQKSDTTAPASSQTPRTTNTATQEAETDGQIYITEIFPNPEGSDDAEYIKLYNPNNFDVILDNWIIDDQDGGSKPHTIQDRAIKSQDYLVLGKEETKLTLNNTSDEVRLFNKQEELIDSVLYDDVQENQTYQKTDEGLWFWSGEMPQQTPDYEILDYNASDYQAFAPDIVDIDLTNIRELELGTEVRVQGTVAVEPGVLGKTYFYITGSPGIQVYFYKKDWPYLAIGDVIGVIGELSESNNETRLKIANKEDIVPLYESDPPTALETQTGEIGEELEGALIQIQGELVEKKGTSWFIDDGSGEAKITFQPSTNIKKPSAKDGDWINVVGLVSETRSGYRVLPRYQEDINIINLDEMPDEEAGRALGVSISGAQPQISDDGVQRFRIAENNKPQKIFIYLLTTSSALIILLISLIVKFRVETKKRIKALEEKTKKH